MPHRLATRIVWSVARAAVWVFYRIERAGGDVPDGAAVLFANHANGLLDPALVVATSRRTPRFLAKSTLFSLPVIGWFVSGAGSIPVYRRQDAGVDPARNAEMFQAALETLARGEVICLFPEGISHSSGRVEPLRTGAARMVLDAWRRGTRVALVPIGLNFEHKAVFRSTVLVAYGPGLRADAWADVYAHDPAAAVAGLTAQIERHLRDVVVEAEPTEDADLVDRVERLYAAARGLTRERAPVLERRRLVAEGLAALRERDAARYALLYEQLRRYERRRARFGLAEGGYLQDVAAGAALQFAVREGLLALLLGSLAFAGAAAFALPYAAVTMLARLIRTSLDQVATVKILAGVIFYGLWIGTLAWLAWRWSGPGAALLTAVGLPALGIAALVAIEREAAVFGIVRSYLASWWTRDVTEERLVRHRASVADLLDETYRWLAQGKETGGSEDRPLHEQE